MLILPNRRIHHQPSPPSDLITEGLVSRWKCDDGAGAVLSDSIGTHPMDFNEAPAWAAGLTANFPFSAEFNNLAYALTTEPVNSNPYGPVSVCFFVRLLSVPSPGPPSEKAIFGVHVGRPAIRPWQDDVDYPSPWSLLWLNKDYPSSTILSVATTYHIAIVRRLGNDVFLFTNGARDPLSYNTNAKFSDDVYRTGLAGHGTTGSSSQRSHMRANDLRVYARALFDAEVLLIATGNG